MIKLGRPLPKELKKIQDQIEEYAREYGLDFFPTIFEVLDYDQLNMVAAYGGFPVRYPHWRFGMEYERLSKGYTYGVQKIYEMVINNNPCYAYLLESNTIVMQKTVIAHVLAHNDFFKNNEFFRHTNRRMIDEMANHAIRIRRYIDRYGLETVEEFIDVCLSLDNLIDYHSPYFEELDKMEEDDHPQAIEIPKLKADREYMNEFINPEEFIEAQKKKLEKELEKKKKFPPKPVKDVMWFLIQHAPLTNWQRDVMGMIREEAYYFAPQAQTKILNEGWACVAPETPIVTERGLLPMREVVTGGANLVHDGEKVREIYDRNIIRNTPTVEIKTALGFKLKGSHNHRIMTSSGQWVRLDQIKPGQKVRIPLASNLWPQSHYQFPPEILAGGKKYSENKVRTFPKEFTPPLARLVALFWSTGRISEVSAKLYPPRGTENRAEALLKELFDLDIAVEYDGELPLLSIRDRAIVQFLSELCHLRDNDATRQREIPLPALRSPREVVLAFIEQFIEGNRYAEGLKSTAQMAVKSETAARQLQLLLANLGILAKVEELSDSFRIQILENWLTERRDQNPPEAAIRLNLLGREVHSEAPAEIVRPQPAEEPSFWTDEVVSITEGRGDVYDISVAGTHRYVGGGFVNHNSYWHSKIMTEKAATDSEIIDFAEAHAGVVATSRTQLNPYKLGLELFRDIEDRWNKGRFGPEYEECDDMYLKMNWDLKLGLGMEKIFQVRKIYNDVTFIDEFLTEEFVARHKLFGFDYNRATGQYEISTREFKKIKEKLLFQLTNFGQPFIRVLDANFENRAELLLGHRHEGVDLHIPYARAVLQNIDKVWKRPVHISTKLDGKGRLLSFDGTDHSMREFTYIEFDD